MSTFWHSALGRSVVIVLALYGTNVANAAVLTVSSSGTLTGATGVWVDGASYTVRFVDGTCSGLFGGCNSVSDFGLQFPHSQIEKGGLAAQALLDQVFLNGQKGQFDSLPNLTKGCSLFGCTTLIPYGLTGRAPSSALSNFSVAFASNTPASDGSGVVGYFTTADAAAFGSTTALPDMNAAIFTKNAITVPTVPLTPHPTRPSTSFDLPFAMGSGKVILVTEAGGASTDNSLPSGKTEVTLCGVTIGAEYYDPCHQPDKAYYSLDFDTTSAIAVTAARSGTVVSVKGGADQGMGYKCANSKDPCIVIKHDNGLYTEYREFTTALPLIIDQEVKAGQIIGELSTKGHLHFQVMTFDSNTLLFNSQISNTALRDVTVGGAKITDYRLQGSFEVVFNDDKGRYIVQGVPKTWTVYDPSRKTPVQFSNASTINATIQGSTAAMSEGSPAYIWYDWAIPLDATFFSFEFFWENRGDGDYLSLYFEDSLLFSFLGTDFSGDDYWGSGLIYIGQFTGQTGRLLFALNNVGDPNADLMLRNLTLYTEAQVPEPSTFALFFLALFGLVTAKRWRRRGWLVSCHSKVDP